MYCRTATEIAHHVPSDRIQYIIDNYADTGVSCRAAYHAIGRGVVLTYAMSDMMLEPLLQENISFCR